jgi:hypothetical protein
LPMLAYGLITKSVSKRERETMQAPKPSDIKAQAEAIVAPVYEAHKRKTAFAESKTVGERLDLIPWVVELLMERESSRVLSYRESLSL